MSYSVISRPDTEYGPCIECEHTDCQELTIMAGTVCWLCTEVIGYDRAFTRAPDDDRYVHQVCLLEAVDAGRV